MNKLNRIFVSELIEKDYKQWTKGDKILIDSPCGTGKTHFIKQLVTKNKHTGFLIVSNRTNLRNQYKVDLKGNENFNSICYQTLQKELQKDKDYMKQYAIIIFDEIHHLIDSASYDKYTDIIYREITQGDYNKNILIFMSATIGILKDTLRSKFNNLKIYEQPTKDYSYIEEVYSYKDKNSLIEEIANDTSQEKWLILVSNKEDGETYKKELEAKNIDCKFICSRDKKNKEVMDEIVKSCTYSYKVLIATSILQEGVNLHDELIKNVAVEFWTEVSTIQGVSRIRIDIKNPKSVKLYIRKRTKSGIRGKYLRLFDKLNLVNEFNKCNHEGKANEFISERYNRNTKRFFYDVDGVYYLDKDGNYQQNLLALRKLFDDYWYFKELNDNIGNNENYQVNKVLSWFGLEDREIIDLDEKIENINNQQQQDTLKSWLKEHMEQRLFKEQQSELIELIGLRDRRNNRLQKSISILNAYLEENYNVQLISKIVKINKQKTTVWIISNME